MRLFRKKKQSEDGTPPAAPPTPEHGSAGLAHTGRLAYDPAQYGWVAPTPAVGTNRRSRSARRPKETLEFEIVVPPSPPATVDDLSLAVALAESQFAAAQEEELERAQQEEYQAAVDRAIGESLTTIDYDELLRDIHMWIRDLEGATGDVSAARRDTQQQRQEIDAQMQAMADASLDDPENWHRLMWLSEQYPKVEARLGELQGHVQPISDAVQGLRDLCDHIEIERPALEEAQGVRDTIIAQLFDKLGQEGLDAHHPMGAYGREAGPGSSGANGSDLRSLVQQLIEEARRIPAVPPLPKQPKPEPQPEPQPEPEPELPAAPEPEPPVTQPEPEPEPELAPEPEPAAVEEVVQLSPPPPEPPAAKEKERRAVEAPKFQVPNLSTRAARKPRQAVFRTPEDKIARVPTVVTLYHELSKGGVVADVVGWQRTKAGGADGTKSSSSSSIPGSGRPGRAAPRKAPTPITSGRAAALRSKDTEADTGSPSAASRRAAEVSAFQPASLPEVADFVADIQAQGGVRKSTDRWATLAEAAAVHDRLVEMIGALSAWKVDAAAGVVAEAHRLADYMEQVSKEAGRVTYPHDPLRVRMKKQGLPWDPSLLTDLRWAAQHAAAALMTLALETTNEATKVKSAWKTQVVLQPLGSAAMGAFKVHQFCGGFNMQCTALWATLYERTDHWGRSIDPKWLRTTKIASA